MPLQGRNACAMGLMGRRRAHANSWRFGCVPTCIAADASRPRKRKISRVAIIGSTSMS